MPGRLRRQHIIMKRVLAIVVVTLVLAYAGDYLALQYRNRAHNAFGQVTIQNYYAVPRKDGRTEYMLEDPVTKTCVHSLFPHLGYSPCWYLSRRTEKRENI